MEGMFGFYDAIFFVGYSVITLWIGFAVARREKATVSDYFRAGNTLPWYVVGSSIVAAGISSEQFVGEVGYAYKLGIPVFNWEWLVFPAISVFLLIFVPIYVRNRITTMPEYLEKRYGPYARTIYAVLIVTSYIFANFALVFYTGGFAMEKMWGINKIFAVWILAILTGAYTVYGGMLSVAWTDLMQCILLLGGGLYVFFAGMHHINWDFAAVIGTGQRAHLFAPQGHEVPWTSLVILALSTNVWYYATDQFVNQRCLGARNEWHAKMGVLFAAALQLLVPLATCAPGIIYYVMNPNLADHNAAYPSVVAALVPVGLRGLVVAAVLGAIMSTISGLVNSTSTMVTLDIFRRWKAKDWPEAKLVRFGQWTGAGALVAGALFAPVVMKWESIFRYCQDIWGPMAAPAAVVFMGGALWKPVRERGAIACLILSIVTIPFTFTKLFLSDAGIRLLPANLDNALVFSSGVFVLSMVMLVVFSLMKSIWAALAVTVIAGAFIFWLVNINPAIVAILIVAHFIGLTAYFGYRAKAGTVESGMWDQSMLWLPAGEKEKWYYSIWFWWLVLAVVFVAIYISLR
jgi:SSS family solute:Na+ symporter